MTVLYTLATALTGTGNTLNVSQSAALLVQAVGSGQAIIEGAIDTNAAVNPTFTEIARITGSGFLTLVTLPPLLRVRVEGGSMTVTASGFDDVNSVPRNRTPQDSLIAWPHGDHSTIPSGAGYYWITTGAEAGQVWRRVTNGGVPYRAAELESVTSAALYYRDARVAGVAPSNTGAANLLALQTLVDTVPERSLVVVPPGEYFLGNTLFINRQITLDTRGVTWKLQSDTLGGASLVVHGGPSSTPRTQAGVYDLLEGGGPYYDQELVGARVLGWKVKSASGAKLGTSVFGIYLRGGSIEADVSDSYGNGLNLYHCREVDVPTVRAVNISNYGLFVFQSQSCRFPRVYTENAGRGLINKHSWHGTGVCNNSYGYVELVDCTAELWAGGGANYEGVPGTPGLAPIYEGSYEYSRGVTIDKLILRKTISTASPPQLTIARHSDAWTINELIYEGGGFSSGVSPLTIGANGAAGGIDGENHTIKKLFINNMDVPQQPVVDYGVSFHIGAFIMRNSKFMRLMKDGVLLPFGTVKSVQIDSLDVIAQQYLGASGDMGIMPRSTTELFELGIKRLELTPIANSAANTAQALAIQAKKAIITGGYTYLPGPVEHTTTIGALLQGAGGEWRLAKNTASNPGTLQMINLPGSGTGPYSLYNPDLTNSSGSVGGTGIVASREVRIISPTYTNLSVALNDLTGGQNSAGQRRIVYGTAAPTTGTWDVGDLLILTNPPARGIWAYECTTAGTPGTWSPRYSANIAYADAVPTTGAYTAGDIVLRTGSTAGLGKNMGWICYVSGSPGTWAPLPQTGIRQSSGKPTYAPLQVGEIVQETGRAVFWIGTGLTTADWALASEPLPVSVTWDAPNMAAGSGATTTASINGATVGDEVRVSTSAALPNGVTLKGEVTAAGTVTLSLWNGTAAAYDPPSLTYYIRVMPR